MLARHLALPSVLALWLSLHPADCATCEPWCDGPCDEINGDVVEECGGCNTDRGCHAGAPGYARDVKQEAAAGNSCAPRAGAALCWNLAHKGFCDSHPVHMQKNCAGSCDDACTAADVDGTSKHASSSWWTDQHSLARHAAAPKLPAGLGRRQESWCGILEDESRVADRGYFVARGVVPADELQRMYESVRELGEPTRYLCAASNVQPAACRSNFDELSEAYPQMGEYVRQLLSRWRSSGFAERAGLGTPLEPVGSEFLSTNRWKMRHNSTCVLAAVFDAAAPYSTECAAACPSAADSGAEASLSPCWLNCMFAAVMWRLPRADLVAAVRHVESSPVCDEASIARYSVLQGPTEYVMGDKSWAGTLRAWITFLTNVTTYQGWHDWHVDGAAKSSSGAEIGRYHKVFVMVHKAGAAAKAHASGEEPEAWARTRTNLRLVPNFAQIWDYEHQKTPQWQIPVVPGCDADYCDTPKEAKLGVRSTKGLSWHAGYWPVSNTSEGGVELWDGEAEYDDLWRSSPESPWKQPVDAPLLSRLRRIVAYGLQADWPIIERLSCPIPLAAGDLVFAREDVWHRTQDLEQDRLALKIDVLRFPEPTDSSRPAKSGRTDFVA